MPTDPAELLALARKLNGIDQLGNVPWHIKATYELMDDNGASKQAGVFEEFFVSNKKYKLSYAGPGFSQRDYSNDGGLFRAGTPAWPDLQLANVRLSLAPRFPSDAFVKKDKLKIIDQVNGAVQLKCLTIENAVAIDKGPFRIDCFDKDLPVLRFSVTRFDGYERVYNHILAFYGVYVSGDARIDRAGKTVARVHIEKLEPFQMVSESLFVAPPDAVAIPRRVSVTGDEIAHSLIRPMTPRYPQEAKDKRIQGTVIVHVVIGKDGRVIDAGPISGPRELVATSVEAVRKALYRPYIVDGEPVEVDTTTSLVYMLTF